MLLELAAREGVPLIDVRERDEFAAGHVPGAVNVPLSELGDRLDELPGEAFDVICQAGGRSARAVKALESRGYNVAMTRETDVFIPLYDRPKVAHREKADAFISIHHNAPPFDRDPTRIRYQAVYAWNAALENAK